MVSALIAVHSVLRWFVLAAALVAVARAVGGWRLGRSWIDADDRAGRIFVLSFDVQVLMGLLLYVGLSPVTQVAFADFGAAMGDSLLRFWAVEHIFGMLVALALAHVGRARARRVSDDRSRHRTAAIFFGLALLIVFISIPWPGTPAGRPLLPTF